MVQSSRLSVLHLFVGTTCVALYLAISRHLNIGGQSTADFGTAIWVLWNIGTGAALGGVMVLVSRRGSEERFPAHPGERLLVVISIDSWIDLIVHLLMAVYFWRTQSGTDETLPSW